MGFLNILGAISGLGSLFGGGAKASADAREKEAALEAQRDQTAIARYNAQQQAQTQNAQTDLSQRQFALQAPGARSGNAVRGDILSTLQKPSGQHGRFNFVANAPTISDQTRQVGQQTTRDALLAALQGDHFAPLQTIPVPQATPLPQAGTMEKVGGIAGLLGGIANGVAPLFKPRVPSYGNGDYGGEAH